MDLHLNSRTSFGDAELTLATDLSLYRVRYYVLSVGQSEHCITKKLRESVVSCGKTETQMEVVIGVDGMSMPASEYYDHLVKSLTRHGKILSPAELGCALSHVAIMRRFIASSAEIAVVFEEDAMFDAYSFEILRSSLQFIGPNDILVAGCQQGLEPLGPIFGCKIEKSECYIVHKHYWTAVKRTCAYAVGKCAADHIVHVQTEGLWGADDFRVLCPSNGRLLFCRAFSHPQNLTASLLERERTMKTKLSRPRRLLLRVLDECWQSVRARSVRLRGWLRRVTSRLEPIAK